jgi:hypothetical protein
MVEMAGDPWHIQALESIDASYINTFGRARFGIRQQEDDLREWGQVTAETEQSITGSLNNIGDVTEDVFANRIPGAMLAARTSTQKMIDRIAFQKTSFGQLGITIKDVISKYIDMGGETKGLAKTVDFFGNSIEGVKGLMQALGVEMESLGAKAVATASGMMSIAEVTAALRGGGPVQLGGGSAREERIKSFKVWQAGAVDQMNRIGMAISNLPAGRFLQTRIKKEGQIALLREQMTQRQEVAYRARGGPLAAGQLAVVGERGPELFMPSSSGQVIPNRAGMTINLTINGDINGMDDFEQKVTSVIRDAVLGGGFSGVLARA